MPGLIVILALAALFLESHPPTWVEGAAAGAGAAVPAVALQAALSLAPASWRRAAKPTATRPEPAQSEPAQSEPDQLKRAPSRSRLSWSGARWLGYLVVGGVAGALAGEFLVLALAACGMIELLVRDQARPARPGASGLFALALPTAATGGLLAVAWVAFKVGALSYGGGFVIIPLMQHDAVHTYHWMTGTQFLSAVALGQITPGPVVQTVAVVGYAAAGVPGGLLASLVAFAPSFAFVLIGATHFAALRRNAAVQAFLTGAGPAAIGAIAGSTIPLALDLTHLWQAVVLVIAAVWLVVLRKNIVAAIAGAALLGVVAAVAGFPVGQG